MTVKVYREGKNVEVYEEIEDAESIEEISEAEEEAKEYEEEMKMQMELEKMKVEDPERYIKLKNQNKKENLKGIAVLIWFFGSIILMLTFAGMQKVALMLSVFGHYFAVFGFMAFFSNKEENLLAKLVPCIFMIFGLIFMVGCILYQFGIINF